MPQNIQFTRPVMTGARVERLAQIMDTLTRHSPVNLHSAIVVLAPRPVLRGWMHAEHQLKTGRVFVYITPEELGAFIAKIDNQVVFIVDELHIGTRGAVLDELKKLNMELGHRMFLNLEVPDPDKMASGPMVKADPEALSVLDTIMSPAPTKLAPPTNG